MRASIWDRGAYAGYARHPELELKWFIDHALAVKRSQVAAGAEDFGSDPQSWGNWIADVERPDAEYRYRYGDQLDAAKQILAGCGRSGAQV